MKKYQGELLAVVNSWLNGSQLPNSEHWDALFELAKAHGIANVFYLAIKNSKLPNGGDGIVTRAKKQYLANLHQQISQDYYAKELTEKLHEKRISYMPLKGYILREFYPSADARTSCDVDVVYDKNRKDELGEIMLSLGFERGALSDHDESWSLDSVTLEMHFALAPYYDLYSDYYKDLWSKLTTKDGVEYAFTKEDFYIYFIVHAAKHFYHSGLGVRFVLDLYFLRKGMKDTDEEYISDELEKLHLSVFAQKLEQLSRVWFAEEEETYETSLVGDFVFDCGLYGKAANQIISAASDDKKEEKVTEKHVKRKYFFHMMFPPAKDLSNRFPILRKCPFLLPIFWVYRWFAAVLFRRKNIKRTLHNYNALETQRIKKRFEVMNVMQLKETSNKQDK